MAELEQVWALAIALGVVSGCGEEAQENLSRAARSLHDASDEVQEAAIQSAEALDEKAEVAKEVADRAGKAYVEAGSGLGESATPTDAVRCAGESYEIDRTYVKTALAAPLTAAGESSFHPPTTSGLRIDKVDPQSPLRALDVRDGDLLVAINGQSLDTLDATKLVDDLETASTATATFERDGERITKTIHIVGDS